LRTPFNWPMPVSITSVGKI